MSILDRYLIRLTIPPFLLALGVFTFVLAVEPMLDKAKDLLAKGVHVPDVGILVLCLLPSALSLTIPMSLLTGLLMALGRLSADREAMALLACGISPLRLLRPVLLVGLMVAGVDMYILMRATPQANQTFLNITGRLLTEQTAADIKQRVFFKTFPGKVLYVSGVLPDGRWSDVFLFDTGDQGRLRVTLAETGQLVVDRDRRQVAIVLNPAREYAPVASDARLYIASTLTNATARIDADSVFGSVFGGGYREMGPTQILAEIDRKHGIPEPAHNEIMHFQQMFSFPVACLVLAVVGLGLGLSTSSKGRLAGLTLGLGVILVYYAVMGLAEAWTKGTARTGGNVDLVAAWSRWVPNIVLGVVGALAVWRQTRPSGLNLLIPAFLLRVFTFGQKDPRSGPQDAANEPATRVGAGRSGVVVRVPRLGLSWPRTLDRYVSRLFLRTAALSFLGLLALLYIGGYVDLAEKLKRSGDVWIFLNFLAQSTPQFLVYIVPVAVLVSVLSTIGGLTRTGELIVMRACGVSLYRTAIPLLVFALLGSGVLFLVEDRVLGEANRTAHVLRDQFRDHPQGQTLNVANDGWLVGSGGKVYHYAAFEPAERSRTGQATLRDLSVFEIEAHPFRLRQHLHTSRAVFNGTAWMADAGWRQTFDGDASTHQDFGQTALPLDPVEDFQRAQLDPGTMRYGDLREYVKRLGAGGYNVAEPTVNLHRKIAFPMVTIVMTLLAIPFGVTIGRKGALYGIGLATILAGGYFLLTTFFVAAGSAGLLPPMLAAWAANILFGAGAAYMILTVRT